VCADRENIQVFECHSGNELVALAVLGLGSIRRRHLVTSRQLVLSQSANRERNVLVEFNELLCRRGHESEATRQLLLKALDCPECDELQVSYGPEEMWLRHATAYKGVRGVVDWTSRSWSAPLSTETTVQSLLSTLSSSRRSQLRRTLRTFEKDGPLTLSSAASKDEALEYFHRLGDLHTQRWLKEGVRGSFSNPIWKSFHVALIQKGFDAGAIQLLRITSGNAEIGYIYNFIWRGAVLMLQTGFLRNSENLRRSGYASHLLAMQFNGRLGMREYDFLPGDYEYKRVLAKQGRTYVSIRFQRKNFKFAVENAAVWCVRKARGLVSRMKKAKAASNHAVVGLLAFAPPLYEEVLALLA
jgi:hypothetical protein